MTEKFSAKHVLVALGAPIERYAFANVIDWDEVARVYGEEFRDGYLVSVSGSTNYDDEGYYVGEPSWFICVPTIENPKEVISRCFVEERQAGPHGSYDEYGYNEIEIGDYLASAKPELLWMNGILLCSRKLLDIPHKTITSNFEETIVFGPHGKFADGKADYPPLIAGLDEDDGEDQWEQYYGQHGK